MEQMIYFDNSSTTKPSDGVVSAISSCLVQDFANASSLHIAGVKAHKIIENTKKAIAFIYRSFPYGFNFYLWGTSSFCKRQAFRPFRF